MKACVRSVGVALVCWIALICAGGDNAVAQGSTGGSVPKSTKTISGGDSGKPTAVSHGRKPASVSPMNGTWLVKQDCNNGKFEVELRLTHTSPTEFAGSSAGMTTGMPSQVADGRVNGRKITFVRQAAGMKDRWAATLQGPNSFTGTSTGPNWRCTYTAARR